MIQKNRCYKHGGPFEPNLDLSCDSCWNELSMAERYPQPWSIEPFEQPDDSRAGYHIEYEILDANNKKNRHN